MFGVNISLKETRFREKISDPGVTCRAISTLPSWMKINFGVLMRVITRKYLRVTETISETLYFFVLMCKDLPTPWGLI